MVRQRWQRGRDREQESKREGEAHRSEGKRGSDSLFLPYEHAGLCSSANHREGKEKREKRKGIEERKRLEAVNSKRSV
jgi:hypothetical protein